MTAPEDSIKDALHEPARKSRPSLVFALLALAASIVFVGITIYGRQGQALDAANLREERRSAVLARLDVAEKDRACQARINSTFFAIIGRSILTSDPEERQQLHARLLPVVLRLEQVDPDNPASVRSLCDDPIFR